MIDRNKKEVSLPTKSQVETERKRYRRRKAYNKALSGTVYVLTDWSYAKLKKAPCHYYGSYYEKDFVIAAHNYKSHFGRLSELQTGDIVFFTDMNGETYYYEVALLETLPKEATKEMITGGFDLSLYTCTPGGASRVTVRCNAARSSN